jgi:peptide/nickel transport system permease protein
VTRYLAGRLIQIVPVLVGVSVVVFLLVRIIPGDPAVSMLGSRATPQLVARVHNQLGLGLPLWQQYLNYLGHALRGDFGISFFYQTDVSSLTLARLPLTLTLIAYATFLSLLIAVPLAATAAARRDGLIDQAIRLLVTASLGLPSFWLAIIFALVFGVKLRLFPIAGAGSGGIDTLWHITLPALTIAFSIAPILTRALRSSLIEVMRADFVITGRAAGLRPHTLLVSYVLRNSLLPLVTVLAVNVGWLIGGTVIVEQVFGLPGLGSLLITSISTRDYAIIQLVTLVLALFVIGVNLLTDLSYMALDPRVSLSR